MRVIYAALLTAALSTPAAAVCFPASGAGCFDGAGPYVPLVNPYPSHERPLFSPPTIPAFPPQASDSADAGINLMLRMQEIEALDRSRPVYAPLGWPRRY